jgi:hypothetical protein
VSSAVVGCYTIAARNIPLTDIAQYVAKRLARYPLVPAVRVGRFAVAERRQVISLR